MIKTLEKTGRTEEDAISAALAELGPCPIHRLTFLKGLDK